MGDSGDVGVGLVSCLVGSVFFGTQYVPIRPFETGDGLFVQWMSGVGIFLVGLVVQAARGFPTFVPLSMLGGFLWASGNAAGVVIVRELGMGQGILVWSFTNLVFGWASGRFGWFGLRPQIPASDLLNGLGLALSLISTVMFAFIRTTSTLPTPDDTASTPLLVHSLLPFFSSQLHPHLISGQVQLQVETAKRSPTCDVRLG